MAPSHLLPTDSYVFANAEAKVIVVHQKPPKIVRARGAGKGKAKARPKKRARICPEIDDLSGMSALDSAESAPEDDSSA